jgi:hypothetical protein
MKKLFGFSFLVILFSLQAQARPSEADREKFKAAFEACLTETGSSRPERGVRPSDEERAKMHACLSSKGIKKPEGDRRGKRHQRDEKSEE